MSVEWGSGGCPYRYLDTELIFKVNLGFNIVPKSLYNFTCYGSMAFPMNIPRVHSIEVVLIFVSYLDRD